jgi:hypothetical protein
MKDPIPELKCSKCLKFYNPHSFSMGLLKSILQKNIGFKMKFIREIIKKGKAGHLICKCCKPVTFKTLECIKCKCDKTRSEFSIEEKRKDNGYICKNCYGGICEKYYDSFNKEFFNLIYKGSANSSIQSAQAEDYRSNVIVPFVDQVREASKSRSLSQSTINKRYSKINEVTGINTSDTLYFYEDTKGEFEKIGHRYKSPVHSIANELKNLHIVKASPFYF